MHIELYSLKDIGRSDRQSVVELTPVIPDDGYADGGEPYTDEELEIINED